MVLFNCYFLEGNCNIGLISITSIKVVAVNLFCFIFGIIILVLFLIALYNMVIALPSIASQEPFLPLRADCFPLLFAIAFESKKDVQLLLLQ